MGMVPARIFHKYINKQKGSEYRLLVKFQDWRFREEYNPAAVAYLDLQGQKATST